MKAEETVDEARENTVEKEIVTEEKQTTEYKLTWKEILLASVTSGQFGLLFSLIFFVYHQVDEYIPKWIENSVKSYVMEHDIYGWIFMVAILLALSWVISTIGYALKHGDFTVNRKMTKSAFHKDYLRKRTRLKVTSYSRDYDKRRHFPSNVRLLCCASRSHSK